MLVNTIERDARNDEWKAGIVQGKSLGFAEGSHQTKLETAKNLLDLGLSVENIAQATGLSREEGENL